MNSLTPIILASASPRRKELLEQIGVRYTVHAVDIDETPLVDESPLAYVQRLAAEKSAACLATLQTNLPILAADTAVVLGDVIMGKPTDEQDALRMLRLLSGHTHQVYTGVAFHRVSDGKMLTDFCVTDVPMRAYSNDEIAAYVQTGDPLDKAGAYAIQHPDFQPVESMRGCYASVMGLPMCHVVRALRSLDVFPAADVPLACQNLLNYECPVSSAILRDE